MDYAISGQGGRLVVSLSGRFTHKDRRAFQQALEELPETGLDTLTIDFRDVDFIDSSALGMLLLLRERAGNRQKITLSGAKGQVSELFDMTHFAEMFLIEE